ncbi:hypothetical protein NGRA_2005 [Nosema granulosis]|uniref:Uncharacterized protein n=1 Tax=Nosema granulosis TaxID=83296 RepID=A0A9P6KYU9_9MICR|nr:hypothetical protein NGRA_2005 [Nosema granulosis]
MIFIYLLDFIVSTSLQFEIEHENTEPLDLSSKPVNQLIIKQTQTFNRDDNLQVNNLGEGNNNQNYSFLENTFDISQSIHDSNVDYILRDFTQECKCIQDDFDVRDLREYLRSTIHFNNTNLKSAPFQFYHLIKVVDNIVRNICDFLGTSFKTNNVFMRDTEYINSIISIYEGFYNLQLIINKKKALKISNDLKILDEFLNILTEEFSNKLDFYFGSSDYSLFYKFNIRGEVAMKASFEDLVSLLLLEIINIKRDVNNLSSLLFIVFLNKDLFNHARFKKFDNTKRNDLLFKSLILLKISSKHEDSMSVDKINRIFIDILTRYINKWRITGTIQNINNLRRDIDLIKPDNIFFNIYTHDNIVFLFNILDNRNSVLKKIAIKDSLEREMIFHSIDDQLAICLLKKCCKLLNNIKYALTSNIEIIEEN